MKPPPPFFEEDRLGRRTARLWSACLPPEIRAPQPLDSSSLPLYKRLAVATAFVPILLPPNRLEKFRTGKFRRPRCHPSCAIE